MSTQQFEHDGFNSPREVEVAKAKTNPTSAEALAAPALPYKTADELRFAFHKGAKFNLHYHGQWVREVTSMRVNSNEHTSWVEVCAGSMLPVKIKPDGSCWDSPRIFIAALSAEPKAQAQAAELPGLTSRVVNDACWEVIHALPDPLSPRNWNEFKPAFYKGLQHIFSTPSPEARETAEPRKETQSVQTSGSFTARDGVLLYGLRLTFDEWQAKHGPNGGAYDIEQQRAGWNGALASLVAAPEARETAEPKFATDRSFGWCPDQCPITRLPFFMWIQHPHDGWVPTYGGPLDSYTIPVMGGLPTEPFHERPLERERFDHDAGYWVAGVEEIPLRVAHDDALAAPVSQAEPSGPCEIADAARVIAWARELKRRPANSAFTAGPERQAAYWIEWAQAEPSTSHEREPLARAMKLLVRIYDQFPDARPLIERSTGNWFVWGVDREAASHEEKGQG